MVCELGLYMMKTLKPTQLFKFAGLMALALPAFVLISCGKHQAAPQVKPAVIEDTESGFAIIEQEFSECEGESIPENPLDYVQYRPSSSSSAYNQQRTVEAQYRHIFSSIDHAFPLRGSWRKSKAEILDIVDRHIWSPEQGKVINMLEYFDMVLMINVAARNSNSPENSSAQRMQVLVRNSPSNDVNTWNNIHTWPISSGRPCGKKIETPTGVFKFNPSRIYSDYYSNLFDNVRMFETMFLYHSYQDGRPTGVAIHGTEVVEKLGRRDSGGCVRVYKEDMTCLFDTITGRRSSKCLAGGKLDYYGRVPSFLSRNGEADPEFLRSGHLEVNGYKVLIAIFDDANDTI